MARPWNSLIKQFIRVSFKYLEVHLFIQYLNYKNLCSDWVLTKEESELIWHPDIEFQPIMEFKPRPSISKIFPNWTMGNRLFIEKFQLTFSCNFDFAEFPFDSHECPLNYGDGVFYQHFMRFNTTLASFGEFGTNLSTNSGGDPIILDNLPFQFEFQLVSLPNFELMHKQMWPFSYTGIVLKMKRKSLGQLLIGYFYPTASFALLSMISFLIKPDMVSSLF